MASRKKEMPAAEAWKVAAKLQIGLMGHGCGCVICGSLRRGLKVVHDIDMVVEGPIEKVLEALPVVARWAEMPIEVLTQKPKKGVDLLADGIQVNVLPTTEDSWGSALLFFTGSALFNVLLRGYAKKQGMKLNQYGLFHNNEIIAGKTELQVFEALDLPWILPKDREDGATLKKYWKQEV